MKPEAIRRLGEKMRLETALFIETHLNDPSVGYPLRQPASESVCDTASSAPALTSSAPDIARRRRVRVRRIVAALLPLAFFIEPALSSLWSRSPELRPDPAQLTVI